MNRTFASPLLPGIARDRLRWTGEFEACGFCAVVLVNGREGGCIEELKVGRAIGTGNEQASLVTLAMRLLLIHGCGVFIRTIGVLSLLAYLIHLHYSPPHLQTRCAFAG